MPNSYIGAVLGESAIISPHHFAGTARVGDVVNEEFKVKGVKKLYVADASVIPKTPRVNTMATAMMVRSLLFLPQEYNLMLRYLPMVRMRTGTRYGTVPYN